MLVKVFRRFLYVGKVGFFGLGFELFIMGLIILVFGWRFLVWVFYRRSLKSYVFGF